MNSTLSKALIASLMTVGVSASVLAQLDYDPICVGTNTAPYSTDFRWNAIQTPYFIAGVGASGTVSYANGAIAPDGLPCTPFEMGATVPIRGRIGFALGAQGSIQDTFGFSDQFLIFNHGMNPRAVNFRMATSGGSWSFARLQVNDAAGVRTSSLYGANAMNLFFTGASNRYMYAGTTNGTVEIRLVIDVVGDAARLTWRLQNNAPTAQNLGLWFGQWISMSDPTGQILGYNAGVGPQPYITVPGLKPLVVEQRWNRSTNSGAFPSYINFSVDQFNGYGLQLPMERTRETSDENGNSDVTPVDRFTLGDARFIHNGGTGSTADPAFADFIFANDPDGDGNDFSDVQFGFWSAYTQKWEPAPVPAGGFRDIVAYYRSTNMAANYTSGYTALVDAPKAVSTTPGDPTNFTPNPMTIRAIVDNTGITGASGFGVINQTIAMENVKVTLQLPQGLHAAGNPGQRTIVQYINQVNATQQATSDFAVEVDPDTFGELEYTVTFEPNPGSRKVVRGIMNIATTPRLLIREGANLVAPPWNFTDASWNAILSPLALNTDFQAFTFNPVTGQYIPQASAERGKSSWIISTQDLGYRVLQGNPVQPTDQFPNPNNGTLGGAPLIELQRGWNLVGNPYNYAVTIGQLVGARKGVTEALTYQQMVNQGIINGSFSFYDADLHNYRAVQQATDRLQPNYGYWIFSNEAISLSFPPVFDLFVRSASNNKAFRQSSKQYRLQIAAQSASSKDVDNFAGISTDQKLINTYSTREAPGAPTPDVLRAYFTENVGGKVSEMAQLLRKANSGRQSYNFNVYSKRGGTVQLTWPNLRNLPANLDVRITDLRTRRTTVANRSASYNFQADAQTTRSFKVDVTPMGIVQQRIGTVSTVANGRGNLRTVKINYTLAAQGYTNIRVLRNGVEVAKVADDLASVSGLNSVVWPVRLAGGEAAPTGTYTLEITSVGDGGSVARKLVLLNVSR